MSQVQEEGKVGFGPNSAHREWVMWDCWIQAGNRSRYEFHEQVHEEAHCLKNNIYAPKTSLYWLAHATFRAAAMCTCTILLMFLPHSSFLSGSLFHDFSFSYN